MDRKKTLTSSVRDKSGVTFAGLLPLPDYCGPSSTPLPSAFRFHDTKEDEDGGAHPVGGGPFAKLVGGGIGHGIKQSCREEDFLFTKARKSFST